MTWDEYQEAVKSLDEQGFNDETVEGVKEKWESVKAYANTLNETLLSVQTQLSDSNQRLQTAEAEKQKLISEYRERFYGPVQLPDISLPKPEDTKDYSALFMREGGKK
ncbi:MAG: Transcriptional regulator XRE family [Podoviridae sp. ctjc_2]|nr:MAG: Transcriptional regulator XRE family [Podoviridae sp. ctjc_2]